MKVKALTRARQDEIPPNEENRNAIFNSFDSAHILNLSFADVVNFYKHGWFFINTCSGAGLANKK